MPIKSVLYADERVVNQKRHWLADGTYYAAYHISIHGAESPLLFTQEQIEEAAARAARNPEDIPERHQPWWMRLLDLLAGRHGV